MTRANGIQTPTATQGTRTLTPEEGQSLLEARHETVKSLLEKPQIPSKEGDGALTDQQRERLMELAALKFLPPVVRLELHQDAEHRLMARAGSVAERVDDGTR